MGSGPARVAAALRKEVQEHLKKKNLWGSRDATLGQGGEEGSKAAQGLISEDQMMVNLE